ncbi:MAG: FimB/Mfa2 family fimbrial subunit [Tannerellaceae bacterium]|jgi:hypothetical protein|nr:FimB/Mfa2 family fimbrial subunit [Tannerellaceae bacterium]
MKQIHHIYVCLLLLAAVAMQSCIQDDLSGCMTDKQIYFDYDLTLSQKGGINPEDITRLNLFVFNEDGLFVKEIVDEAPRISPDYVMTIGGLKTGLYRFVAWGNLKDQYALSAGLVPGKTKFDDLRVLLQSINNNREVTEELKPLFFATHTEDLFTIQGPKSQRIHLNLIKDTYRVNVTVVGMDATLAGKHDYKINIEDDNGIYTLNNDFAFCEKFTYTQPCRVEDNKESEGLKDLKSSLTVLRLTEERKPRSRAEEEPQPFLRLVNEQTKTVVLEDGLVSLVKEANQLGAKINFATTYEFDITYELSQESTLVVYIYINGWRLIRQPVPLV